MKRAAFYTMALAVASLSLWYGASAYRASAADALPALIEQAPAGATMIAYADLAALRESPWTKRLESFAQPAQVDSDYTAFVDATGFDYQRDLDRVVIANSGAASDKVVVFAEGRFDRKKIEQYALRTGKLQQENGRAVYVVPSATQGSSTAKGPAAQSKDVRFTFLAADRIALSSGGELSGLASAGASPSLDSAMRERLSRVAGAPIFATIKTAPFAAAAGTTGDVKTGVAAQMQSLRWVSLAMQPDGNSALLSLEGECDRPEDAQKVAGTLELMRALFRGALADPKTRGKMPAESAASLGKLIDAAKITTETTRVRLLISLTPDMLSVAPPPALAVH